MLPSAYLDADSCWTRLVRAVRRQDLDVVLGTEELADGAVDELHLARAVELRRVIITANTVDFSRLNAEWARDGREHFGIVIWAQLPRRSPEALAEAIVGLLSGHTRETMANSFHHV